MSLQALLFAHHVAPGSGEPLAAIDVAGLSVLERQVVLARRLGADRIFVMAERMPPGLAAALDHIGESVRVVRSAAAISTEIADGDLILTLQEGLVAEETPATALIGETAAPIVAVSLAAPAYADAERLDSDSFWAGFAIYEGAMVRQVAADIGEWDLQSTLLRTAAGGGVPRVELRVEPSAWRYVGEAAGGSVLSAQLIDETRPRRFGWPSRFLFSLVEPRAVTALLPTRITGRLLTIAGVLLGLLASLLFATGWPWPALGFAIVAPQLSDVGGQLARLRLEPAEDWVDSIFDWFVEPTWYLALAAWLADQGYGFGAWSFAAAAIAFRFAMIRQSAFYRRLKGVELEIEEPRLAALAAGRDTAPWLLVVAGLGSLWLAGLGAVAVYAAASFFVLQARLFARLADPAGAKL
ncbi:MAG: hypothetical protein Q7J32_08895 [Sphingomonadaceae bacterium]|nr:hypothetical protein [Sphingomonadaceae bacterium]